MKAKPNTMKSSTTPRSQFTSRGYLYSHIVKTRSMWATASTTIADAPQ